MRLAWEPARVIGGTAGGLGAIFALLVFYEVLSPESAALWMALSMIVVPPVQAEITRWYVMATKKITDAGHSPDVITADAKRNTGG